LSDTETEIDIEPPVEHRQRRAGVLLHPTSLPGPHGIGDLGAEAFRFVDYLASASQSLWQILPLGPTGFGNSPYAARSAFAGNPLLISLDSLRERGLLQADDLADAPAADPDRVAFDAVAPWKLDRLRTAYEHVLVSQHAELAGQIAAFREANAGWLADYALFMALREKYGGAPWTAWQSDVRLREPDAVGAARTHLANEIGFHEFVQFLFVEQWTALRAYARERGVRIMGDLPIFVALDSADVWANRALFDLDREAQPNVVAGVPPDYFSADGQRWGNPLYRWDAIAAEGYRWWIDRFRQALQFVDVLRIDHFRGFESYWAIPAAESTAKRGQWMPGPGRALFDAARAALGEIALVAEDLGLITPAVEALRRDLGIPGMRVLQFAFGDDSTNPYLPHNYDSATVVYTGTHDNDTTKGWFATLSERDRNAVLAYVARDGSDIAHDLIRLAYASVAETAIAPLQDVLSLGGAARMNLPGEATGNWNWRFRQDALTENDAAWLASLVQIYGR
jgi:4-alpha-glucanotransferase